MTAVATHDACIVRTGHRVTAADFTSLFAEMEAVIFDMQVHGRCYTTIRIADPSDYFLQLVVRPDGRLHAEASSTGVRACCGKRHPLSAEQQRLLQRLGWHRPTSIEDSSRVQTSVDLINFHKLSDARWLWPACLFAELLVRTAVEVFTAGAPEQLELTFGVVPADGILARA